MPIIRVTAEWTNFRGGPGYSNFYFAGASTVEAIDSYRGQIDNAFKAIATFLPDGLEIGILREAHLIDELTGELIEYVDGETGITITVGSSTSGYSGASGAVVTWNTATVVRGRRVRGRTFLVPLAGNAYEGDGTLTPAALTAVGNFGDLASQSNANGELIIWARPAAGGSGAIAPVTAYRVPDLAAVLRSRRD